MVICVLELVGPFKKFNNIDVPYKIVGRRDGDIASCYADVSKAKDVLDWSCTYNIEDMVKIHIIMLRIVNKLFFFFALLLIKI